jgi:hypothetical protein
MDCVRAFDRVGHPVRLGVLILGLWATSGCAFQYYDARTGTQHLWGVGHLAMKVAPPADGVRAVVRGTSTLGLAMGRFDDEYHFSLGWTAQRRLDMLDENAAIRLEWASTSLFAVRVGSSWPAVPDVNAPENREDKR